jgi:hypothetical protein
VILRIYAIKSCYHVRLLRDLETWLDFSLFPVREALVGNTRILFLRSSSRRNLISEFPPYEPTYVRFFLSEFDAKIPCISLRREPMLEEHTRLFSVTALRTDYCMSLQIRICRTNPTCKNQHTKTTYNLRCADLRIEPASARIPIGFHMQTRVRMNPR